MNNEPHKIEEDDVLLRIFIGEDEKKGHTPLYEHIVLKCRELDIAGATVLRGIMGYGADRRLHTSKLLDFADTLPMVVEIIDSEDNINRLLPHLDEVIHKGFITMEKIHVIRYRESGNS